MKNNSIVKRSNVLMSLSFLSLLSLLLAAPAASAKVAIGARMDLQPLSTYSVSEGGFNASGDGAFGFGAAATLDFAIIDFFKVSVDAGYFSVKGDGASSRDSLIDTGARFTGLYPISMTGALSSLNPYGFLAAGYSLYLPNQGDSSSGFWIGGGGGVEMVFGSFGTFAEMSYTANIYDAFSYKALALGVGAKLYF